MLDHQRLHLALYAHCYLHDISDAAAAADMGLPVSALCDLKAGAWLPWETVLRVCLWLEEDPREFVWVRR